MRSLIAVAATVSLLIGCGVERRHTRAVEQGVALAETPDPAPETFAIGTAIDGRGAVPANALGETFTRKGEAFLSVDLSGASSDQDIEVRWIDDRGEVIRKDQRRAPRGSRYVAFSSGRMDGWSRGPHRAVVLIDGRTVSEKRFGVL